jgi:hypothetical protein
MKLPECYSFVTRSSNSSMCNLGYLAEQVGTGKNESERVGSVALALVFLPFSRVTRVKYKNKGKVGPEKFRIRAFALAAVRPRPTAKVTRSLEFASFAYVH